MDRLNIDRTTLLSSVDFLHLGYVSQKFVDVWLDNGLTNAKFRPIPDWLLKDGAFVYDCSDLQSR